jgi:hypothetical protein
VTTPLVLTPGLPLFAHRADALSRAKRRCRRKQGRFVRRGECRCASTCPTDLADFSCQGNKDCACVLAAGGRGFCAGCFVLRNGCSQAPGERCPTGYTCVVNPGCVAIGVACKTSVDCPTASYGCIRGKCEQTRCSPPCAT